MNGGIDSITSAEVLTEPSRNEPGFSAAIDAERDADA